MWLLPSRLEDLHAELPDGVFALPVAYDQRDLDRLLVLLRAAVKPTTPAVVFDDAGAEAALAAQENFGGMLVLVVSGVEEPALTHAKLLAPLHARHLLVQTRRPGDASDTAWLERELKVPVLQWLRRSLRQPTHPLRAFGVQHLDVWEAASHTADPLRLLDLVEGTIAHRLRHRAQGDDQEAWVRSLAATVAAVPVTGAAQRVRGVEQRPQAVDVTSLHHIAAELEVLTFDSRAESLLEELESPLRCPRGMKAWVWEGFLRMRRNRSMLVLGEQREVGPPQEVVSKVLAHLMDRSPTDRFARALLQLAGLYAAEDIEDAMAAIPRGAGWLLDGLFGEKLHVSAGLQTARLLADADLLVQHVQLRGRRPVPRDSEMDGLGVSGAFANRPPTDPPSGADPAGALRRVLGDPLKRPSSKAIPSDVLAAALLWADLLDVTSPGGPPTERHLRRAETVALGALGHAVLLLARGEPAHARSTLEALLADPEGVHLVPIERAFASEVLGHARFASGDHDAGIEEFRSARAFYLGTGDSWRAENVERVEISLTQRGRGVLLKPRP